ncbi:hypothetical protein, partial [Roseateles sp.]|uniref:hypothetical protein n=1 Tax=Roseateles sp. TaxID=1971397 RepID=UPI003BA70DD6
QHRSEIMTDFLFIRQAFRNLFSQLLLATHRFKTIHSEAAKPSTVAPFLARQQAFRILLAKDSAA